MARFMLIDPKPIKLRLRGFRGFISKAKSLREKAIKPSGLLLFLRFLNLKTKTA